MGQSSSPNDDGFMESDRASESEQLPPTDADQTVIDSW